MRIPLAGGVAAILAAGAALTIGGNPASAATATDAGSTHTVSVSSSATSPMTFSSTRIREGVTRFNVSTTNPNGIGVLLFKPHAGVAVSQVAADFAEEFNPSTAAQGTRDLVRDSNFYGLADTQPGTPLSATVSLGEGTYYAVDTAASASPSTAAITMLKVVESDSEGPLHTAGLPSVSLTSTDRFVVHGTLPAHGSVVVRNVSDTIHFMDLIPVAPGTTDAQVQAYFDSGVQTPPPFALNSPGASTDVLSPGKQLILSYSLPAGTYVMLCFVADDVTGMPHALMGMHKVVVLH